MFEIRWRQAVALIAVLLAEVVMPGTVATRTDNGLTGQPGRTERFPPLYCNLMSLASREGRRAPDCMSSPSRRCTKQVSAIESVIRPPQPCG